MALWSGSAARNLFYGVSPHDAATFAGVSVVVFAVAILATLLPTRGAIRVDLRDAMLAD
jgi:ABC-type lipoprotein release transport system permease subunit